MKIAYTKIGRSQAYSPEKWGVAGGDWEAPLLLNRLARAHPDVEFVIVGHNDGAVPSDVGLPANVTNALTPERRRDVSRCERVINVGSTPPPENTVRYIEYMRRVWDPVLNECDGMVAWVGQNDTINQPIPKIGQFAKHGEGLGSSRHIYIRNNSYLLSWVNAWRDEDPTREPVWLCSDIWNVLKARDLKWPHRHPVLCQYEFVKSNNHYRWSDPRTPEECGFGDIAELHPKHFGHWKADLNHVYSGLELGSCVPSTIEFNDSWEGRRRFGVMINQSRDGSGRNQVLKEWVRPMFPDWIVGQWDEKRAPDVKPYPWHALPSLLQTVRCSLAVPIKMVQSWATPKAWEMFAAGVVCFMHPRYDSQGHILPTLAECDVDGRDDVLSHLARWLRVEDVSQLRKRVDHLNTHREDWEWIVKAQRAVYNYEREKNLCLSMIGDRLGLPKIEEKITTRAS